MLGNIAKKPGRGPAIKGAKNMLTIFYKCDPSKNKMCKKTWCQNPCKQTTFREFAVKDKLGRPIVAFTNEGIPQGGIVEHRAK